MSPAQQLRYWRTALRVTLWMLIFSAGTLVVLMFLSSAWKGALVTFAISASLLPFLFIIRDGINRDKDRFRDRLRDARERRLRSKLIVKQTVAFAEDLLDYSKVKNMAVGEIRELKIYGNSYTLVRVANSPPAMTQEEVNRMGQQMSQDALRNAQQQYGGLSNVYNSGQANNRFVSMSPYSPPPGWGTLP